MRKYTSRLTEVNTMEELFEMHHRTNQFRDIKVGFCFKKVTKVDGVFCKKGYHRMVVGDYNISHTVIDKIQQYVTPKVYNDGKAYVIKYECMLKAERQYRIDEILTDLEENPVG